ncbi:MAG: phage tail sheath C-terminal domain-containing protein [Candidatus Nanopelagicales bacterium]
MARTITSPGVQITEKDLSLRTDIPAGTNVVVPGFASQGPISEPVFITTASELEAIYGIPTTPAERYFYYSCKEVLNSPAVLTTVRLPYGDDTGSAFSKSYSGLFYPMLSSSANPSVSAEWTIGSPKHVTLSPEQYSKLIEGNFTWTNTHSNSAADVELVGDVEVTAGFVVLNDLQTTINEIAEGYYIGFADNKAVSVDSPNFDSILAVSTLSADDVYTSVVSSRLDFNLSATKLESDRGIGSVSESLEKVGFIGFETDEYQDHLSLGVFKVRRSTADASLLSLASIETYLGSFDSNRKQTSPTGGILANSFIEDKVNEGSPTIKMFINPAISKTFSWTFNSSTPVSRVTVSNGAKALFPVGSYVPDSQEVEQTKIIGSVPSKLDKVLRTLEIIENTTVDVLVDAGLSTIYAITELNSSKHFNDETYVDDSSDPTLLENWTAVVNELVNFSQNTRKDCFTIIDPLRPTFISGKDSKVIDLDDKTFTTDIYNPLKAAFGQYESNYAATYGNWVKILDTYTSRKMWLPFSGYAAAVYARSDSAANTWAAPAGFTRGSFLTLDLAFNPNQKQRDRLYEISVNPVVLFSGEGYVVFGQKTLQTRPTAFDRVNVRRLFLTLERAVQRTIKYFIFEPNTDFTRNRVKSTIAPIFDYAKNTEGVYDYLIVCDERNNTPDVIDRNELVVDIYLKPVRTAEFILVNFIATRTSQNFQELI